MTLPVDVPTASGIYAALLDLVLIKATLLMVAAGFASRILRLRTAAVRHGIWAVAFAALLILPAVCLVAPGSGVTLIEVRDSAPTLASASHGYASAPTEGVGEATSPAGATNRSSGHTAHRDGSTRTQAADAGPAPFHLWIVTAWMLGFLLQLGRLGARLRTVAAIRGRAAPCPDRVRRRLGSVAREVGLPKVPTAIVSGDVASPATFGVIDPSIVLPVDVEKWSDEELEAALLHELVHLRRHDYVTHLITQLVRAAYWMNPLVWYAGRRLAVERERSCDDLVILDRVDPIRYAEFLVRLTAQARSRHACQAVSFAGRSSLAERIGSLLDRTQVRHPLDTRARLAIIGVAGLFIATATAVEVAGLAQSSDSLVAALSDPEPLARRHAAWAMGESEDRAHVGPLIERLEDPDSRVRAVSAWALGEIKDSRAVEPLSMLLSDDAAGVREMAVLAIGEIEDPAGLAVVREAASLDVSTEAREWAEAQIRHPDRYAEVFAGELFHPTARRSGLARYLDDLTAPKARTRILAAQRLGVLGAVEAVDSLLDAFEDDNPAVRASAVWAVDEINPSRRTDGRLH